MVARAWRWPEDKDPKRDLEADVGDCKAEADAALAAKAEALKDRPRGTELLRFYTYAGCMTKLGWVSTLGEGGEGYFRFPQQVSPGERRSGE